MNLILISSIVIRLLALVWSVILLQRLKHWWFKFMLALLGLMTLRQVLTLWVEMDSWPISISGQLTEIPGLLVSILVLSATIFLERIISEREQAKTELQKQREENLKMTVIAKERSDLQDWINTFDTFVGKFDPDGVGILFNAAPMVVGGLSEDDVVGEYFPDTQWWTHSKKERARIIDCFEKANNGLATRIETNFRSADGTPVPIIFNCQPVMGEDDKVKYITAEGKIIVEEVKLREALEKEKEKLELRVEKRTSDLSMANKNLLAEIDERKRAEENIRHLQSVLMAIRNINQLIVREKNREILLSSVCEILIEARNYMFAWIGLIHGDTKKVLPVAQAGFEEGYLQSVKITWDDSETGRGPTGTAIRTNEPCIMRNLADDPQFKPWESEALKRGYNSSAAVPIAYKDRVFGALNIYVSISDSFDEEEIDLLLQVSQDIGFALYTIELETDREKVIKELTESRTQLRNLTSHLLSVREEEKNRIALEIHDELGQALTALKMDIAWIGKNISKDQGALLEKKDSMLNLIDLTIKTVQRISSELRPRLLDDLGLAAAIEWQVEEFVKRTGIKCDYVIDPENMIINKEYSTAIFRILQETLTNVVRHANATAVNVRLERNDKQIILKVDDNGSGISKSQVDNPTSYGLVGIRERVLQWGGGVEIQGVGNRGTTVTITLPIEDKKGDW